jgi:hypothetical protein
MGEQHHPSAGVGPSGSVVWQALGWTHRDAAEHGPLSASIASDLTGAGLRD